MHMNFRRLYKSIISSYSTLSNYQILTLIMHLSASTYPLYSNPSNVIAVNSAGGLSASVENLPARTMDSRASKQYLVKNV